MYAMIRRDESGFTLIELVVAAGIGTIVMLAALAAMEIGVKQTSKVTSREDSLKRGRVAMGQVVSELRSQICGPTGQYPIAYGDQNTVRFYSYNLDPTISATAPELHELSYNAAAKTITDKMWPGTSGPPANPTRTRNLLANVTAPASGNVFTYYQFRTLANGKVDTGETPTAAASLPVPLSAVDVKKAVRIAVEFNTQPLSQSGTIATPLQEDVVTRIADPNADNGPAPPTCL
jgi:prepilin-type N-terminal cleavage/methylation domain-containing protein